MRSSGPYSLLMNESQSESTACCDDDVLQSACGSGHFICAPWLSACSGRLVAGIATLVFVIAILFRLLLGYANRRTEPQVNVIDVQLG
jgi:hypothetical protein